MNDLRTGFLQRHRKRLHDPIDLAPPPVKRVCPKRSGEGPATEVPSSTMHHPDEAAPSAATAVQPDVVGPGVAAMVQPDVLDPEASGWTIAAMPGPTTSGLA